jgi:hypothetical protein
MEVNILVVVELLLTMFKPTQSLHKQQYTFKTKIKLSS